MSKAKIAVYTSIFGDYDTLKYQTKQSVDCDFLCFTDNPDLQYNPQVRDGGESLWEIVPSPPHCVTPRMGAKFYKVMSHLCVPDYDYTLWIDGTATIHDPHCVERMIEKIGTSKLLLFGHPFRHCIHAESSHCWEFPKYRDQPILAQSQYYLDKGIRQNEGLWACGVVFRQGYTSKFNNVWWEEIYERTEQDQLSFPYAARVSGLDFRTLPGNIFNNSLVSCVLNHDGEGAKRG